MIFYDRGLFSLSIELGTVHTEGCAEGFIFYPQTAVLPMETASKGVHPINIAYAHNEKPVP